MGRLTFGEVLCARRGGSRADEFEELVRVYLHVLGELFWGEVARHGLGQRFALGLEELQGAAVILFEGAGPGVGGLLGGLVKGFAFEDEGGEFDGAVCAGGGAAFGADEAGGGVEADRVPQEVRNVAGLLRGYPELRGWRFVPLHA